MLNDQYQNVDYENLENREEKEKLVSKILKIERRKRNRSQTDREIFFKSRQSRGERETFLPILEIERRTRHEN